MRRERRGMDCRDLVEVVGKSGIQAVDRPVTASSLGLPDSARARLLVELGGLLRVYCAETSGNLPSASKLRSNLEGTGYDSLVLVTTNGQKFLAVYVNVGGEETHKTVSATEVAGLLKNAGLAGEADATSASDRILELLTFEEEPKAYNNRGLFSDDYLEHRVPEGAEWAEDVSAAYERFRELYEGKKDDLAGLDEANTEMEFVEPALALLGFHPIKRAKTKTGAIPDYALFGSAEDKNAASTLKKDSDGFYARTLAVVEGKYWGRSLDVYTKKEDQRETKQQTSSPEMQVVRYLQETDISWGILTKGAEWRLYHGDSLGKAKKYYSVHFEKALASEEDFKRFYLFFRREAFLPKGPESKSFLEGVLEGSEQYAIRVGNNLKDVIFTRVFPQLAKGFLEYHSEELRQPVDEEILKKTYRGTLALLYRLLFLLYAEARGLLPTQDRLGYGARGINAIKADVAKHRDEGYTYTAGYVLWQSLEDLFRVVDEGNRALKVPPYNGGLFKDDGNHELLGTHRISDHHLAPAIDALSRQEDEYGENRFVDYGFVGVRELGSVYEGLLEFALKIADENLVAVKEKGKEVYRKAGTHGRKKVVGGVNKGEPYLVNDTKERKATGSYYTPRYIVDYIVENTLRPLVEDRRAALGEKLKEVRQTDDSLTRSDKSEEYRAERRREAGALETLLDLKVLDPAMGSGHFLVATVDYLTDEFSRLISELDAKPIIEQLTQLRVEIEESLERYGTEAGEEQLSDANLLKRMILKRCVYGVDLNQMAVELAKLSLWLDAFTVGAPLSFLDHHLKHGNSLIGSSVREVRREVETSGSLLGNQFTATLIQGTELMQHVGEIPDATEGEVRESIDAYAKADKVLAPYKRMLDIWTSQHFGNDQAERFLSMAVSTGDADHLTKGDYKHFAGRDKETIDTARYLSDDRYFFHWELEFPEVFYEGARERENPGFDAVVGNPPYNVMIKSEVGTDLLNFVKAKYSSAQYNPNAFALMCERASMLIKARGSESFIIPSIWMTNKYFRNLRHRLAVQLRLDELVHLGFGVFEEIVDTSIFFATRTKTQSTVTIKVRESANQYIETIRTVDYADVEASIDEGFAKHISRNKTLQIAARFKESLKSAFLVYRGIETKDNSQYLSDTPRTKLDKPILAATDVSPHYVKWGGTYVRFVPEELKSNADIRMYDVPEKALLRRTGSNLVAGVDYGRLFALKNLYVILALDSAYKSSFLTAVLNSKLMDSFNQAFLSNEGQAFAQIKKTDVERLPLCPIDFATPTVERDHAVQEAAKTYAECSENADDYGTLLRWVEQELAWTPETGHLSDGRNDTVHDFLAHLAEQMTALYEKRVEIERTWREWVEAILPSTHRLTKTFLEQGWVELGLESGWEGVKTEFQARNAIPSGKTLQSLRRETEETLGELRPLYEHIQRTAELIDQIVYRLYGLTEDEIAVVEASAAGT